ncbi:MAG: hypothetical protein QOE70_2750, partial [Chthoniobacter sp.]|nr:hypothetical protein [Chthoniobacter sp.]
MVCDREDDTGMTIGGADRTPPPKNGDGLVFESSGPRSGVRVAGVWVLGGGGHRVVRA